MSLCSSLNKLQDVRQTKQLLAMAQMICIGVCLILITTGSVFGLKG